MMQHLRRLLPLCLLFVCTSLFAQDSVAPFAWQVQARKVGNGAYELSFTTQGNAGWQLYSPTMQIAGSPTTELQFADSAVTLAGPFTETGAARTENSEVFGQEMRFFTGPTTWKATVNIAGSVPASMQGTLLYSYGKGAEFYPSTVYAFTVPLEGGVSRAGAILRTTIDVDNPVSNCGDDKPTTNIFNLILIGLVAGLLSLFFPCIFPLIPLTVSYFTKKSVSRRQGIRNAVWYGFSIFLIFILLSLPFHLFNIRPEILNNISTNVPLNLLFFAIFIVFALSFFGLYEIVLPSSLATKADARSGLGDLAGIFFMALTLVIVSFSCTGPILGSLLVGSAGGSNGAWQLTAAMGGFGLGLGFPFVLFALFPRFLQTLPKSGGWMNELKAVFGFIELAMALKFLSQADLVLQWGLLKREVFIGSWALIGLLTVLYLCGLIRFKGDSKAKFTTARIFFIALFAGITLYLAPGVTNTRWANLSLISGFAPPTTYSVYKKPVLAEDRVHPLENDYEKALELARAQNKPVLIDFTGWACVNCRRMEETVWIDPEVKQLMSERFIVVSLYVDERRKLPPAERTEYKGKSIVTVGDKWSTFQSENFHAVAQPQYAIISPDEKALTRTKGYSSTEEFVEWLKCGLEAMDNSRTRE